MKTGSGSVNATKQSAQWEVNCRTGVSMEASLNACSNNLRAGERKKKLLHYHLLDFFPHSTILNRYVTPGSPSTLVEVWTN